MDDLQEQNEIAEEIQNAISQPIGFGLEVDEVSVCEEWLSGTKMCQCVACEGVK